MNEAIAAELFSQAVQAKVWLTLLPDDALLQDLVADTTKELEDFLEKHPELAERAKVWYNAQEEV